jgi:ABC-2 type transport system ATP-binding protein
MTTTLELIDLRKRYGSFEAVRGVSLQVEAGTIHGLLGPNGSGKTSTLRMVMDITAPDSGEMRVFGRPRQPQDLQRIGYLPEERGLYRKMGVQEQLLFLAELRGMRRSAALPRIREWLERLELQAWAKKKVEELSKGMQQKIQLVGTIVHDPDIIILDEPFSGLDPINQTLFKDAFAEFQRQGKSLLISTHVMEQAEKLCDSICLISHGRTVLQGKLRAIRREWGGNAFRVTTSSGSERLASLPGVLHANDQDGTVRLLLAADADPATVLRQAIVNGLEIREFRSEEPSLEDIFIKAVRQAEAESGMDNHAS